MNELHLLFHFVKNIEIPLKNYRHIVLETLELCGFRRTIYNEGGLRCLRYHLIVKIE